MLEEIRKQLLSQPETIQALLEQYDYTNVKIHRNYISCGRDSDSSPKAIVIRLENNRFVYVKDYARNLDMDLFSFLMARSRQSFKDVLKKVRNALGLESGVFSEKREVFGGFYKNIRKQRTAQSLHIYPESILDSYEAKGNIKFLRDNISLEAQKYFGIRFDAHINGIIIPIRDQIGNLVGVKVRNNWESDRKDFIKYWYAVPAAASQTLYGYSQNYFYLVGNDVFVFESEKSVMQSYSYGYRNAVGLGSGSLSIRQAQMILEANPKKVVFLHDQGFGKDEIKRNMRVLQMYSKFVETPVWYWDWDKWNCEEKCSPTDLGRQEFERILKHGLVKG